MKNLPVLPFVTVLLFAFCALDVHAQPRLGQPLFVFDNGQLWIASKYSANSPVIAVPAPYNTNNGACTSCYGCATRQYYMPPAGNTYYGDASGQSKLVAFLREAEASRQADIRAAAETEKKSKTDEEP